jgi:hypothetical protein
MAIFKWNVRSARKGIARGLVVVAIAQLAATSSLAWDRASLFKTWYADRICPHCDLSGAPLQHKDLSGAVLQGADLTGADLRFTRLIDADLRNADLSGADLTGADLSGANLGAAVLKDAIFCATRMPDGSLHSDECLQGLWREASGGVMEIRLQGPRRGDAQGGPVVYEKDAFCAYVESGGTQPRGTLMWRNMKRTTPGNYALEMRIGIVGEAEYIWQPITCSVASGSMSCLDGLLSFTLEQAKPRSPGPMHGLIPLRRIAIAFKSTSDVGKPGNREGVGSR